MGNSVFTMKPVGSGLSGGRLVFLWLLVLAVSPAVLATAAPAAARLVPATEEGWPQFRGPRRDGICDEKGLLASWPAMGPRLLWTATNLGRGFSAPIISQGRLFITGDVGAELHLFALDLQGRPVWRATNGAAWRDPHPGARSSVAVSAGRIYHENAHGRLACLDAATGGEVWSVNLLESFGGQNITWGLSECVQVDENSVYATAGGREASMVAFDKKTGAVRWQSEPLFKDDGTAESAGYASPILVEFAGRRLLIGCSLRHLICVDAASGKLQWKRPMPTTYSVLAMMPVLVGDAVFATAPHGKGGRLWQLLAPAQAGGTLDVKEIWSTKLDALQGGVVLHEGRLFGAHYSGRKGWAALDAKTGETLFEEASFVKGAVLVADGHLYALCEDGWMLLLRPGEKAFDLRGRFRLADAGARDAWAHPVIHQGRLYLRYHEALSCYDVQGK